MVTVCGLRGGYSLSVSIASFTPGIVAPSGSHSRTAERNPVADTSESIVKPGCFRSDATSQPQTVKLGYTSAWFQTAGRGSGCANAFMWNSSVLAMPGVP